MDDEIKSLNNENLDVDGLPLEDLEHVSGGCSPFDCAGTYSCTDTFTCGTFKALEEQ